LLQEIRICEVVQQWFNWFSVHIDLHQCCNRSWYCRSQLIRTSVHL